MTPQECENQLWTGSEGFHETFDIDTLALACRLLYDKEPGCAVQQALFDGTLDQQRFRNYQCNKNLNI